MQGGNMVVYRPNDIAEVMEVSVRTVHEWIKSKKLVASMIGGRYYIKSSDLEKFIDRHRVE